MNHNLRYSLLPLAFSLCFLIDPIFAQQPCDPSGLSKLPLQLSKLAVKRDIDACACKGAPKGDPGSKINKANARQNQLKNNFLADASNPKRITVTDMIQLQEEVDAIPFEDLPRGDRFHLPSPDQRKLLESVSLGGAKKFGEGDVVTLIGFVIGARHSNVESGESVNCAELGCSNNDIHIEVTASPREVGEDKDEKMNEEGVVAEISPRHRPEIWDRFDSSAYRKFFSTHPVMFTGQLFYDASHSPGGGPARASVWEVHPVYAIRVCKFTTLGKCPASKQDDESVWLPFDKLQGFLGLHTVKQTTKCKNNP